MPSARAADSGVLRVVGRAALSSKQSVALIQLGRRFVMVGISGDRLNRLCEVGDPDEVAELAARTGAMPASRAGAFDDLLLREAADFGEHHEGDPEGARSIRTNVGRTPKRLSGLLQRLRALQAK
jgi:flagellar biogenesis protein FliO